MGPEEPRLPPSPPALKSALRSALEPALWALAAALSGWASWAALTQPMRPDAAPLPAALPRPATAEEARALEAARAEMLRTAEAWRAQHGETPSAGALEAAIGAGLADNPLVPGPPGLVEACPPVGQGADWLWCPSTATLAPGAQ